MAPPPLEKPDPGDAPDEEETAGALEEALGDVTVEAEVDVSEVCLPFDPQALRLERDGERFLMTDGRSRMKLFRDAREARRALSLIRRYETDAHCFIERPDPRLEYFLVDAEAPSGAADGEDCIAFDPDALEVRQVGGRTVLAEGDHYVLSFPNAGEARQALGVIREHRFRFVCFVGRPDPSMVYMRE